MTHGDLAPAGSWTTTGSTQIVPPPSLQQEHVLTGGQGLMVDGYCHLIQALAQKRLWQLKRECL